MILILSEKDDVTTNYVIEWLLSFKIKFIRINDEIDVLRIVKISNEYQDIYIQSKENNFKYSDINFIWFRRGNFIFSINSLLNKNIKNNLKLKVFEHLKDEINTLSGYLYFKFKQKPSINNPLNYNMNKLIALDLAVKANLKIPKTIVTKEKSVLIEFKQNNDLISKNIQDIMNMKDTGFSSTSTIEINLEKLKNIFFYSLFQYKIDRKFELRIFYLNNHFYTAAIFNDNSKVIDIRDVEKNPQKRINRIVPYILPQDIKEKLHQFMLFANLESGSIDMIVNKEGEHVFLEVNPVGQIDYVSKICNYNIEKEIALQLMKYN